MSLIQDNTIETRGVRVLTLTPCPSGFGEWESSGVQWVRKDSIQVRSDLDGLIRSQTGRPVEGITWDGDPVLGMLVS